MEATDETNRNVIFELDNFEAMIQLSKEVFMQSVLTNLYTYNDRYYLQVLFLTDELEKTNVDNEIAQILEFAHKTTVTQDTLVEYGTCIMERSALEHVITLMIKQKSKNFRVFAFFLMKIKKLCVVYL